MKGHVSADEVYDFVHEEHPSIGKGTVYRNLNILAEEGKLKKIELPTSDRFDFTVKDHYHVRCVKCHDVYDVDMEVLPDLMEKIKDTCGIQFLEYDILFKGICPACLKE